MREEGYIDEVTVVRLGSYLAVAAPVGATTLILEEASDFADEGGSLIVGEVELAYDAADYDTGTIYLTEPLEAEVAVDEEVSVFPLAFVKEAAVVTSEDDEPITAVVSHSLFNRLDEGIREDAVEAVAIELIGDTWYVVDVLGLEPTPITEDELDKAIPSRISSAHALAVKATQDAEEAMGFVASKNRTFRQADEPIEGMVEGDIWFDTDDADRIYVYQASAWREIGALFSADKAEAITEAVTKANEALSDAEAAFNAANRQRTFSQATEPTGGTEGDLWVNTADNNRLYRYSNAVEVQNPDNLFANGSFASNTNGIFTEGLATAAVSADEALFGDTSLRMEFGVGDSARRVGFQAPIELNTNYTFSFYYKGSVPTDALNSTVSFRNAEGQEIYSNWFGFTNPSPTEWQRKASTFIVTDPQVTQVHVSLFAVFGGIGTPYVMHVDGVKFQTGTTATDFLSSSTAAGWQSVRDGYIDQAKQEAIDDAADKADAAEAAAKAYADTVATESSNGKNTITYSLTPPPGVSE